MTPAVKPAIVSMSDGGNALLVLMDQRLQSLLLASSGIQYDLASDDGVKMRVWSWANSTSLAIYNIIRPIAKWRFYCFTILAGVFVADFPTDRGMEYITDVAQCGCA
jgi:hypothetical protein